MLNEDLVARTAPPEQAKEERDGVKEAVDKEGGKRKAENNEEKKEAVNAEGTMGEPAETKDETKSKSMPSHASTSAQTNIFGLAHSDNDGKSCLYLY